MYPSQITVSVNAIVTKLSLFKSWYQNFVKRILVLKFKFTSLNFFIFYPGSKNFFFVDTEDGSFFLGGNLEVEILPLFKRKINKQKFTFYNFQETDILFPFPRSIESEPTHFSSPTFWLQKSTQNWITLSHRGNFKLTFILTHPFVQLLHRATFSFTSP